VSLTLVLLSDEPIDRPVGSVRPYVDEVVVARTGEWCAPLDLGVRVLEYTKNAHPELYARDDESGLDYLTDLSAPLNAAIAAATSDYVLWLDSDDTLEHPELLPSVLRSMRDGNVPMMCLDYVYSRDEKGRCTVLQQRERIVRRDLVTVRYPAHFLLDVPSGTKIGYCAGMQVIHHKGERPGPPRIRNHPLKVLERVKDPDARVLFHLGMMLSPDDPKRAREYFESYLDVGTWDREKAMVRIRLGTMAEIDGDFDEAERRYDEGAREDPRNPDGWFGLARLAYSREAWAKCCAYTEQGLQVMRVPTPIVFDPVSRQFTPHVFYHIALAKLGRIREAFASCCAGLSIKDDSVLRTNKKMFEQSLTGEGPQPGV
jgi:hypothetical protein